MEVDSQKPSRRSDGTLNERRHQLPWPKDRRFRILSIDGGGIRPEVLVAIDSDEAFNADQTVGPNAEVHILPAIAGG